MHNIGTFAKKFKNRATFLISSKKMITFVSRKKDCYASKDTSLDTANTGLDTANTGLDTANTSLYTTNMHLHYN